MTPRVIGQPTLASAGELAWCSRVLARDIGLGPDQAGEYLRLLGLAYLLSSRWPC